MRKEEVKTSRLTTGKLEKQPFLHQDHNLHHFSGSLLNTLKHTVCPELDCNGVEDQVLPAVRTPPRSSGSGQTASEACLEEAHREAGFSKPFTVSLSGYNSSPYPRSSDDPRCIPSEGHKKVAAGELSLCCSPLEGSGWTSTNLCSSLFLLPLPAGVVNISAGSAPAEGSIPAPAERQAARAEKRTAEEQTHTPRGDLDP